MTVVCAGVSGMEYACMFAALGVEVTVVDKRQEVLEFIDREIVQTLMYHMRDLNTTKKL